MDRPPLGVVLPPLEGESFGLLLVWWVLCCVVSLFLQLCFLPQAILVKMLLTFFNASAVSLPVGILPWSAVASCWAAATTWDSGETVGLVIYWCLKKTVSLILVALVFMMYMRKQRWCCIDVPRLNPASDLVSQVRRPFRFDVCFNCTSEGMAFSCSRGGCGCAQKRIFLCYLGLAKEI
jgi:hypothetical protein